LTQPKRSGIRRLGSHLVIVAKHDLQKLTPAILTFVESEASALMITVAEKVSADRRGFTVRPDGANRGSQECRGGVSFDLAFHPGMNPANRFILNKLSGYKQSIPRVLQLCLASLTLHFISRAGAGTGITPSQGTASVPSARRDRKGATS
jgi:hypothetical protein